MYFFQSKRLGFRQWKDSDIEPFVELNQDTRVMEFFPALQTREETLAMAERLKSHIDRTGYGFFAVEELSTGLFIGFIGIGHPRFDSFFTPCLEIGWRLHADFWDRGYASEGATACLHYTFEQLGFSTVYAFTAKTNLRSKRVMINIGMSKAGEFDHPLLPNHPLTPHVLYVIHKTEK
ncbi:MAG: GNAT family N-acetyltransferase [Spirosomataceae bacterium]